ncbi:translocon-associated protein subunit alpha-like [Nymphaea colorata]|nr:translocon-associated protein subunit alpha-like [Nymphaea colorata]
MASDRLRLLCVLFFLFSILFSSAFLQVVRCQADAETDGAEVPEGGDLGIVGDDIQDLSEVVYGPAPGVETMCIFPKNAARIVPAGEKAELLIGLNNGGEVPLKVQAISASLHLPFDHRLLVQNLTLQEFYNASVPVSVQATFPYIFAVNKYLQPGAFDLVGTIVYEVDEQQYSSVFYNGTIEVVEAGGFLSVESVFLVTLGIAITGLLGLWIYGQIQNLSKKTKRVKKVEVGTGTTDSDMDEWLKGTSFSQSLSQKSKKKK